MRITWVQRRAATVLTAFVLAPLLLGRVAAQDAPDSKPGTDATRAHLGKGYDALKQDRYEEAAQEFQAALAADPTLVLRARFPLAVALFESHKADEARREFEIVRREVGDHPNVLYYLGRLDLDSLDYASAVRDLSKAVVKPPFPDTAYYLGFAYFKRGDLPNAEKWLTEAARANPQRCPRSLSTGLRLSQAGPRGKSEKIHGPVAALAAARYTTKAGSRQSAERSWKRAAR